MAQSTSDSAEAQALQASILHRLTESRIALGLTQEELGNRAGTHRMTIQRMEQDGGDARLSTFIAAALAAGLIPEVRQRHSAEKRHDCNELVHRGYAHARTKNREGNPTQKREAAFADSWQAANENGKHGLAPMLPLLVPNCTQEQASACATVIQWLGTDVGFGFLKQALYYAGLEVAPITKKSAF